MDVLCVQVNKIITILDALAPTVASASGRRASSASASRRSSNITVSSRAGGDAGNKEMTQGATAAQTALEQAALLAGIHEALRGVIKDQFNACVWFEGEKAQTSTYPTHWKSIVTETRDFLAQLRGGVSLLAWAESEETIEVLPQHIDPRHQPTTTRTPPPGRGPNTTHWANEPHGRSVVNVLPNTPDGRTLAQV